MWAPAPLPAAIGGLVELADYLRDIPEGPEQWRMPVVWKVVMTAVLLEVAGLDTIVPEQRTTDMFLRRVEERVRRDFLARLEALTLVDEAQARLLTQHLRWNVQYLRERFVGG